MAGAHEHWEKAKMVKKRGRSRSRPGEKDRQGLPKHRKREKYRRTRKERDLLKSVVAGESHSKGGVDVAAAPAMPVPLSLARSGSGKMPLLATAVKSEACVASGGETAQKAVEANAEDGAADAEENEGLVSIYVRELEGLLRRRKEIEAVGGESSDYVSQQREDGTVPTIGSSAEHVPGTGDAARVCVGKSHGKEEACKIFGSLPDDAERAAVGVAGGASEEASVTSGNGKSSWESDSDNDLWTWLRQRPPELISPLPASIAGTCDKLKQVGLETVAASTEAKHAEDLMQATPNVGNLHLTDKAPPTTKGADNDDLTDLCHSLDLTSHLSTREGCRSAPSVGIVQKADVKASTEDLPTPVGVDVARDMAQPLGKRGSKEGVMMNGSRLGSRPAVSPGNSPNQADDFRSANKPFQRVGIAQLELDRQKGKLASPRKVKYLDLSDCAAGQVRRPPCKVGPLTNKNGADTQEIVKASGESPAFVGTKNVATGAAIFANNQTTSKRVNETQGVGNLHPVAVQTASVSKLGQADKKSRLQHALVSGQLLDLEQKRMVQKSSGMPGNDIEIVQCLEMAQELAADCREAGDTAVCLPSSHCHLDHSSFE